MNVLSYKQTLQTTMIYTHIVKELCQNTVNSPLGFTNDKLSINPF
ncbi:hypothetical protein MNB_SUP05-SYMBIONT-4-456 [hydrothermal vent metagenome]|uniref:Uncharacterized protein n=1 Tax=hydrothermal vent metagenome TaxID=652676 RepID=A0A1W1DW25_9ZZZZ